jgi:hypothetical protein
VLNGSLNIFNDRPTPSPVAILGRNIVGQLQ